MLPAALRRFRKVLGLLPRERYRTGLRHGVAAAIEHGSVGFREDFRTVVDVGANRGQFTLFALERFPAARVIAFEPLGLAADVFEVVTNGARNRVSIVRTAVGAGSGTVDFHVSRRGDSSSILEIGGAQIALFPETAEERQISVPLETLDGALAREKLDRPCLLKIDVQGYEYEVISGAARTLHEVDEVLAELSFAELYIGQRLAPDVIDLLAIAGFRPVGTHNPVHSEDGRVLQADFHFVRATRPDDIRL